MDERALIPGYVKLPPSTVGIGGPLVSLLTFLFRGSMDLC
jgi:hypothetical protein